MPGLVAAGSALCHALYRWLGREGAGEIIQGAAQDKEDDDINTSLTYTTFGKSKKMLEGSLIRQVK